MPTTFAALAGLHGRAGSTAAIDAAGRGNHPPSPSRSRARRSRCRCPWRHCCRDEADRIHPILIRFLLPLQPLPHDRGCSPSPRTARRALRARHAVRDAHTPCETPRLAGDEPGSRRYKMPPAHSCPRQAHHAPLQQRRGAWCASFGMSEVEMRETGFDALDNAVAIVSRAEARARRDRDAQPEPR